MNTVDWVQQNWWAVATGGIGVVVLLFRFFFKHPVTPNPENPVKDAAEKKAEKEKVEAQVEKEKKQEEARTEHAEEVKELVEKQKEETPALIDDPDATNDFLKQVGRDVRRP